MFESFNCSHPSPLFNQFQNSLNSDSSPSLLSVEPSFDSSDHLHLRGQSSVQVLQSVPKVGQLQADFEPPAKIKKSAAAARSRPFII